MWAFPIGEEEDGRKATELKRRDTGDGRKERRWLVNPLVPFLKLMTIVKPKLSQPPKVKDTVTRRIVT